MDENFDGRISYKEIREHIKSLGFNMGLDATNVSQTLAMQRTKKPK